VVAEKDGEKNRWGRGIQREKGELPVRKGSILGKKKKGVPTSRKKNVGKRRPVKL